MEILRTRRHAAIAFALIFLLLASPIGNAAPVGQYEPYNRDEAVNTEIRHQLMTLPHTGVFDWFEWTYEKGVVTLHGSVWRPINKESAERAVKRVPRVDSVVNEIEILPTSPQDDRIRMAVYRAIYRHPALERYAIQALPPIRIIVNRSTVTLEGTVGSEVERTIAFAQARSVPGTFKVTNNLRVDS